MPINIEAVSDIRLERHGSVTYIFYSLAARIITDIDRRIDTCITLFGDVIYGRLKVMELYGNDWVDKPVSLYIWITNR